MDHLSKEKRSWNMSRIRSKNTRPEKTVRSLLHKMGYRFRIHAKDLPGTPDIKLTKYRTVIFCHGCFWHQHPGCTRTTIPKTNTEYWKKKFSRNIQIFENSKRELEKTGWKVIVVWECETKNTETLSLRLKDKLKENT